jgi:hypothetical protein
MPQYICLPQSRALVSHDATHTTTCHTYITSLVDTIEANAERENNAIYFQGIPGPNECPLPAEASVMNPVPFVEPRSELPPIKFIYAKKTFFGRMLSGLIGSDVSKNTSTDGQENVTQDSIENAVQREETSQGAVTYSDFSPAPFSALSYLSKSSSIGETTTATTNSESAKIKENNVTTNSGMAKSDEEMARELQRQFDAEINANNNSSSQKK